MNDPVYLTWQGGDRPHHPKTPVELIYRNGTKALATSGFINWSQGGAALDVVKYRLVPEALLTAVELKAVAERLRGLGLAVHEAGHPGAGETLAFAAGLVLGASSRLRADLGETGASDATV